MRQIISVPSYESSLLRDTRLGTLEWRVVKPFDFWWFCESAGGFSSGCGAGSSMSNACGGVLRRAVRLDLDVQAPALGPEFGADHWSIARLCGGWRLER